VEIAEERGIGLADAGRIEEEAAVGEDSVCVGGADTAVAGGGGSGALEFEGARVGRGSYWLIVLSCKFRS